MVDSSVDRWWIFVTLSAFLHSLDSLAVSSRVYLQTLPLQEMYSLRKLCLPNFDSFLLLAMPCLGNLTHLELRISLPEITPFELILRDGVYLQSLRIQNSPTVATPSIHFRRYSQSLPYLKQFGVSFSSPLSPAQYDSDLFPAICDFLQDRHNLITLELVAPSYSKTQMHLGFGERCWSFLPRFNQLRGLSMTLTSSCDIRHLAQLIPRSVNTLTLSGDILYHLDKGISAVSSLISNLIAVSSLTSYLFVELTTILAEISILSSY